MFKLSFTYLLFALKIYYQKQFSINLHYFGNTAQSQILYFPMMYLPD